MASTNVNLNEAAYGRLKKLRQPNESFSDVILRELPERANTCGELLDWIEQTPPAKGLDLAALDSAMKDRKRRSKR